MFPEKDISYLLLLGTAAVPLSHGAVLSILRSDVLGSDLDAGTHSNERPPKPGSWTTSRPPPK